MSLEYRKIMVPLDGSQFAAEALPHAEKMASAFGSELILFRVAVEDEAILDNPALNPLTMLNKVPEKAAGDSVSSAVDTAERELQQLAAHLHLHDIQASWIIEDGDPAERIINYVQHNDVDLLIMCSHGRKGVVRALVGSVAQEILNAKLACPVFIIQP